jgi:DNA-binding MarR family transcriptional regulator
MNQLRDPSLGDIAAFLGISNAAASKAVNRLVRRKLLRCREGETDRLSIRLFRAGLTSARESCDRVGANGSRGGRE